MIDERHLTRLRLWRRPLGQRAVGSLFLALNYNLPPKTEIILEGVEHIPTHRTVIFAVNHTDRYNYWPFQYKMWRRGGLPFTTTWVKAKYYGNRLLAWFFDVCNNIPLPSRGYLILQDAFAVLGRKLADDEYRMLRDAVDGRIESERLAAGAGPDLRRLLSEPRRDFRPLLETYVDFIRRWNDRVMGLVEQRSLEALGPRRNNLIVFPQGTRSLRLLPAKPGLAQFAVRHEIPIVPVASQGSDQVYPGASPWAKGGRCLYRIGKALSFDAELADCRVREPYAPFTAAAEVHRATFARVSERVTTAINDMLAAPYRLAVEDDADRRARSDRLM